MYRAIPINLCDDTIYQHPPSLLFGTVDKFAQLAHKVDGNDKGEVKTPEDYLEQEIGSKGSRKTDIFRRI